MEFWFICSPSLGVMENWLPVIYEMKRLQPDTHIVCVFTKTRVTDQIHEDNVFVKLSNNYFDEVIYKTWFNCWRSEKTLLEAKASNCYTITLKTLDFISRQFYKLKMVVVIIDMLSRFFKTISPLICSKNTVDIESRLKQVQGILYDVYEEEKKYNKNFFYYFKGIRKFSIHHGINFYFDDDSTCEWEEAESLDKKNILQFVFNEKELLYNKTRYGFKSDNFKNITVPRLSHNWLAQIENQQSSGCGQYKNNKFIFLISRPCSSYLPVQQKKQVLLDIARLAFKELKLRVVVKLHPKEKMTNIYEEAFGRDNYGVVWEYSRFHPYCLGQMCEFAITLYSNLVIDMVAMGTPVIEYLNLNNIPEYDNVFSIRDRNGNVIFDYRRSGIVIGVNDYNGLKEKSLLIIEKRQEVVKFAKDKLSELIMFDKPSMLTSTASIILGIVK